MTHGVSGFGFHFACQRARVNASGTPVRHPGYDADGAFDRVTAIAARRFGVPISIVFIVDHDRIRFKSHHGLSVKQIDREPGLCASAILEAPYILEDATKDFRSLTNPLWSRASSRARQGRGVSARYENSL